MTPIFVTFKYFVQQQLCTIAVVAVAAAMLQLLQLQVVTVRLVLLRHLPRSVDTHYKTLYVQHICVHYGSLLWHFMCIPPPLRRTASCICMDGANIKSPRLPAIRHKAPSPIWPGETFFKCYLNDYVRKNCCYADLQYDTITVHFILKTAFQT